MNELKTWVAPETEIQNFQANEYVSLCVSGTALGNFWNDVGIQYYYKNDDGTYTAINRNEIATGYTNYEITPDSDHNSGTWYGPVYRESFWGEMVPAFNDKVAFRAQDDKIYVGTFTPTEGENGQGDGNGGKAWS